MNVPASELRHTLRRLARSPLFTTIAVLTLAIGIGANTAVFSVIYGVLVKPLPFPEPERLVGVWHTAPGLGWDLVNQSPSLYLTYRDENRAFTDTGMWDSTQVAVTSLERPEQVAAMQVTDGVFPVLGAAPEIGRLFSRQDGSPQGTDTVILSHAFWQSRFGGDPGALGRTLTIDGKPHEVIGVMRPDLHFLDYEPALYLPFRLDPAKIFFGNFSYQGIARLRPGVSLADADADVARMIPLALDRFPMPEGFTKAMVEDARLGPNLRPLKRDVVGDVSEVLWVVFGTVGLVLLVACANVANLFLARAESRQHELAVRSALGASRARVAAELLGESLVLGLLGGGVGVGLAALGLDLLVALKPQGLPRLHEIGIDPTVLAFAAGIALLAALLFGSVAVVKLGGSVLVSLRGDERRGPSAGRGRRLARNLLVVSQIALALVLLVGSGLLIRSFRALTRVDPGFARPREVLTLRLSIPKAEVADPAAVAQAWENLFHRLEEIPGVRSVGLANAFTLSGWQSNDPLFVEERPTAGDTIPPLRRMRWVAPGYFEAVGNPLVAGRSITWDDVHQRAPVVMVTENLARAYWEHPADALGKRVRNSPQAPWREIVGVVGNERDDGLAKEPTAVVYWPMVMTDFWGEPLFTPRSMAVVLRSPRVGTPGLLEEVRQAVWSVDPDLPLADVRTLEEVLEGAMARTSFTVVLLAIAAATALLLGALGTYGVVSYVAAQRTREIGVRMALGAGRKDVSRLVLRHGLTLAAAGVAAGLAGAAVFTRLLSALLFGIGPLDPPTFALVAVAVTGVALVASYVPARRAAATDPVETLRQ
jgi:putative ABC transport system permease protein